MGENEAVSVISIGNCAQDILRSQSAGSVIGITSQGAFALTPTDHILFLTSKPFRGPLTINLTPHVSFPFHQIEQGMPLALTPSALKLAEGLPEIQITGQTEVFLPPIIENTDLLLSDLHSRIKLAASLLPSHADSPCCMDRRSADEFTRLFQHNDQYALSQRLSQLLGCGVGLTPAGDDFICGFFLALSAWGGVLFPGFPFQPLFSSVEMLAYQKTTTLSANLIDCASRGAADERITDLLVWLHTGNGDLEKIIEELRGYGSSSGFDTLRGMTTVVQCSRI